MQLKIKVTFIAFILIMSIVLLAGCSIKETGERSPVKQERLRFIFITTCVEEDFFKPVQRGMREAAEMMDVECTFTGTKGVDLQSQASMVRKAVADGYDGVALNIIDPVAFDGVVREAIDNGVPVVSFNIDDNNTPNARLSAVCQNFYEAGRTLGREAAKFIPDNSKILMTIHSEGISALNDRLRGAQDVLMEKGIMWKVVVSGNEREKAVGVIAGELRENPEINIVLGTGLADTEAAGLVIESNYKDKGYISAGFDLSSDILRLVSAGTIKFTIDQQPYIQGFYPVIQLTLYCRYGIMPSDMDVGAALITRDNVESVIKLATEGYR